MGTTGANPAVVQLVIEGGAGAQAGLQTGDVIRNIDDIPVTTAIQFSRVIARSSPGRAVRAAYREVPGMGHDLTRYESQQDYIDRGSAAAHPFHTGPIDVMMNWMDALLG